MGIIDKVFKRKKKEEDAPLYYDISDIDATGATYRLAIGGRGIGKTYSVCRKIITNFLTDGDRAAYIRRYAEEIQPKNIAMLFDPHIELIKELSDGRFNSVFYRANCFYLTYVDEEGKIQDKSDVFCYTCSINTWMTQKGQDRGEVKIILFDEFLTRDGYIKNEFVNFMNVVSSLVRDRDTAIIYLLANTVSKYSPYWEEFGIKGVDEMEQNEIRLYRYNQILTLAIEYCPSVEAVQKVSSKYFAFDNPQLEMISTGAWEHLLYPHYTETLLEQDLLKKFWIEFDGKTLCGEIYQNKTKRFIYLHLQTKSHKFEPLDCVYTSRATDEICHVHYINDCPTPIHLLVKDLIRKKSVFFSTNEVGEIFRNWLVNEQGVRGLY